MSDGPRVVSDGFLSFEELADRKVLVIGLGISGRAVARALRGAGATVYASDAEQRSGDHPEIAELREMGVEIEIGGHKKAGRWLTKTDLAIPSPGITPRSGIVADAIAEGLPVLSEIEVAFRFTRKPVIAVTGTNGKTTTCRLTAAILAADGKQAVTCGNIGRPFISAALEQVDADVFVVEVSSFQLTFCYAFHPHIAVVTNLAQDHLDWHGSMEAYRVAKSRIAARQTRNDWFVYPAAQPDLANLAPSPGPRRLSFTSGVLRSGDGVWVQGDQIAARIASDLVTHAGSVANLAAHGPALVEDGVAAAAAALAFGVAPESVGNAVASFRPDRHRIERVAEIGSVTFVDDSKATNPHATRAAMRAFDRVVLIAGGRNKGLDLGELCAERDRIAGVVALGEASAEVEKAFAGGSAPVRRAADMDEAVAIAYDMAGFEEVVLLSPACSSFDQFDNYAARGEAFRAAVERLAAKTGKDAR